MYSGYEVEVVTFYEVGHPSREGEEKVAADRNPVRMPNER